VTGNDQTMHGRGLKTAFAGGFLSPGLDALSTGFISLCLSVFLLPLSCLAGTLPKLTAPAKFRLGADRVTLGALLVSDPAEAKLVEQLKATVLTAAPPPGQTKIITALEILRRLESVGVTSKGYVLVVPPEITIEREAQLVTATEISDRVSQEFLPRLSWKDIRLERIDLAESILLPKGNTEWHFNSQPGTDYAKPFYLNINFNVNGEVAKRVFVRTVLTVRERVAVAVSDLKPTQSIREEDIRWEQRQLLSTLQSPIRSSSFFQGRRLRTAIPSGRVLTENLFITIPLVKRGDSVLLVYENDSMRVTTQVKALAMGFRGQRIQVRNFESGKVLTAEVTDEGTARLVH